MEDPEPTMQKSAFFPPSSPHPFAGPTAPYQRRLPSPPTLLVMPATRLDMTNDPDAFNLKPNTKNLDALRLTRDQLTIATGDREQSATDRAGSWTYEQRREAQSVLDYVFLGPTSVARDHDFLTSQGISLVVVVRNSLAGAVRLANVDAACAACGADSYYAYAQSATDLARTLPDIIHALNKHMIDVRNTRTAEGEAPRTGKILITCETGNDWSAAVLAAYIMAVFGVPMAKAVRFITVQRFCCTFDDGIKHTLRMWEDLLDAGAAVSADRAATPHTAEPRNNPKRRIRDMIEDVDEDDVFFAQDQERFVGRDFSIPFQDMSVTGY